MEKKKNQSWRKGWGRGETTTVGKGGGQAGLMEKVTFVKEATPRPPVSCCENRAGR